MIIRLDRFYQHIINLNLHVHTYIILEHSGNESLICSSGIFNPERHSVVTISPMPFKKDVFTLSYGSILFGYIHNMYPDNSTVRDQQWSL